MNDLEQLCNLQHRMWQKFVSKLTSKTRSDGSVIIRASTVKRWKDLLEVDYKDLPEKVKQNIQSSVSDYVVDKVVDETPDEDKEFIESKMKQESDSIPSIGSLEQNPVSENDSGNQSDSEESENSKTRKLFKR